MLKSILQYNYLMSTATDTETPTNVIPFPVQTDKQEILQPGSDHEEHLDRATASIEDALGLSKGASTPSLLQDPLTKKYDNLSQRLDNLKEDVNARVPWSTTTVRVTDNHTSDESGPADINLRRQQELNPDNVVSFEDLKEKKAA